MNHYSLLAEQLANKGIDVDVVKAKLKAQHIELPSWGFANTGTRFKTYAWPGRRTEHLREAGRCCLRP